MPPIRTVQQPKRSLFERLASLISFGSRRPALVPPVFDDIDEGRGPGIRRLSKHAEVNAFWNPAPRKRAS